ncbi:MAG: hypothetical protein VW274_07310 [Thalassolituus sp.]
MMSAIGLVISIAIPLSLLMLGAVLYNKNLQKQQVRQNQARMVRQKASELLEALEYLIVVDSHRELQRAVLDRVTELYERAAQVAGKIAAKDKSVNNEGGAAKAGGAPEVAAAFDPQPYIEKLESDPPVRKVLKSDHELRYGRRQFSLILRTLGLMAKKRQISETAMLEYRRYLKMILLEREVDTYTAQGDVAAARGDVVTAANYFKAARKLLIEFDIQFPEKNQRIRDIAEKTAALYRGEQNEQDASAGGDALAKALSRETASETNEFGMPSDPSGVKKRY